MRACGCPDRHGLTVQRQDRNDKLLRALDCVRRDACYFTLGATRDSADAPAALPFSRKGREPHRDQDVLWIIEVSDEIRPDRALRLS